MNRLLDCLINQLMKRRELYEHTGRRLKFFADLTQFTGINEDIHLTQNLKEDINDKLVNKCHQFKE